VPPQQKKKKKRSGADDLAVLRRIRGVRTQRAPYLNLLERTVRDVLAQFLPEGGIVAEIGSGDGQLRDWLSPEVRERLIHTEPLKLALVEFNKRYPTIEAQRAAASSLPFADGSLSAVLALCVLDVVEDGEAVTRELRRVIRPGGVLIHWLDMSTVLNGLFELLSQGTWVPFPNAVTDPCAAHWPEDVLLIAAEELELILRVLSLQRHPFASPLRQYLEVWKHRPLPLRRAVLEHTGLAENPAMHEALRNLFAVAYQLAAPEEREHFADFKAQPVSSAKYFESRLRAWFAPQQGFEVIFSDVVKSFEIEPANAVRRFPYMSLCVGEQRKLSKPPEALLCRDSSPPPEGCSLLELGVFVFVARRVESIP
jgi:SAM-dependent methyltransferase